MYNIASNRILIVSKLFLIRSNFLPKKKKKKQRKEKKKETKTKKK